MSLCFKVKAEEKEKDLPLINLICAFSISTSSPGFLMRECPLPSPIIHYLLSMTIPKTIFLSCYWAPPTSSPSLPCVGLCYCSALFTIKFSKLLLGGLPFASTPLKCSHNSLLPPGHRSKFLQAASTHLPRDILTFKAFLQH